MVLKNGGQVTFRLLLFCGNCIIYIVLFNRVNAKPVLTCDIFLIICMIMIITSILFLNSPYPGSTILNYR